VVAVGLVACTAAGIAGTATTQQGCADEAPPPSAPPPITIGVSLGLTNGLAAFAAPLRDSIRAAEGQINAAGALIGRPVVFDVRDDLSDESGGVAAIAQQFVDEGAVAVIGPIGSQQVVATQAILAGAHVIQISPSATSVDLTNIQPAEDRWLFRTTPADDFQGAAVMLLADKTPKGLSLDGGTVTPPPSGDGGADGGAAAPLTCSKLALVNIDNAYGNSMGDVIEQYFPKKPGKQIIIRKKVAVELAASYKDVASEVLATGPECLALISYDDVAAQFVRDVKNDPAYAALAAKGFFMMGTDGVYTDGFLKYGLENQADPSGPNVAEGVYGTNPDTQPGTPEYFQFRAIYSSYNPLGDKEAPPFTANAYDAAILIALAIEKAGTVTDRVAIRDALIQVATPPGKSYTPAQYQDALQAIQQGSDIDYKGGSGNVDLETNGNVKSGFIVWEAYRAPAPAKDVEYRTIGRFALADLLDQLK
jgi:branched-chain amino acid transport system substrate-binding protein